MIPAIATGRARYIFPAPLEAVIARTGVEHFVTINGQLNLRGQEVVTDYPFAQADLERITAYLVGPRGMGGVLCRAYPHVGDLDDASLPCGTGADHARPFHGPAP